MENYEPIDKEKAIYKGFFLIDNNQNKEALKHFKVLLTIYPNDPEVLLGLAIAYSAVNKILKAMQTAEKALIYDPYYVEAYILLCELHSIHSNNFIKAEEIGLKALQISPDNAYIHALMGQLYYHRNMQSKCLHYTTKALEINPDNELAHMIMGLYYYNKNNYNKSKEHYYKSLELNPNDPVTIYNMALLSLNLSKTQEGYELIKEAVKLNPESQLLRQGIREAFIQNHPYYKPIVWLNTGFNHWILMVPLVLICGALSGTFCAAYPLLFIIISYIYYCRFRIGKKFDKAFANGTLKDIM